MARLSSFSKWIIVIVIVAAGMLARAEYRAYELSIDNESNGKSRTVITTFDHLQYPQYYPLATGETVKYVNSWMCWENTGNRPICKPAVSSVAAQ
jgi:hypothetical protein